LFQYVVAINQDKDIENTTIKIACLETVVLCVASFPKWLTRNQANVRTLIEVVYALMVGIDDVIDENWASPPDGYVDDVDGDDDMQVTISTCRQMFLKLFRSIKAEDFLPTFTQVIQEMLQQSDWRYPHAALFSISELGEYLTDENDLRAVVLLLVKYVSHAHPRVRFAAINAIGQFADDLENEFVEKFHADILPALIAALDDPVPRVLSYVCAALTNVFDAVRMKGDLSYLDAYLETALRKVIPHLIGKQPSVVKENVVTAISGIAQVGRKNFNQFYAELTTCVLQIVKENTAPEFRILRGVCIECLAHMAYATGWSHFQPFAEPVISFYLQIQDSQLDKDDAQRYYLIDAWRSLAYTMKDEILPYLPRIIPSLFKLLRDVYEAAKDEVNLDESFDYTAEGSQTDPVTKPPEEGESKLDIMTSAVEETALSIRMLDVLVKQLRGKFAPWVEETIGLLLPLVTFPRDGNIRRIASEALSPLLICIRESAETNERKEEILGHLFREFSKAIILAADTDERAEPMIGLMASLKDCLFAMDGNFLTAQEIEELLAFLQKLMEECMERIQEYRNLELDEEQDSDNEDFEHKGVRAEVEDEKDDNELDEQLMVAISEVIGALFKTHKDLTLPFAHVICQQVLGRVLSEEETDNMHRFGLFLIDDMVEYLGIEFLGADWTQLGEALLKYAVNKSVTVRQASFYGIGLLSTAAKEHFEVFFQRAIEALIQGIEIPHIGKTRGEKKLEGHCKANGIAAFGKIIKNQQHLVTPLIIQKWVSYLPMRFDKNESKPQHDFLCDLIVGNTEAVCGPQLEHLPKVIDIFAEILETKHCDEVITAKIKQILTQMVSVGVYKDKLSAHVPNMSEEAQTKLHRLLQG
jgi:hypothetical protein